MFGIGYTEAPLWGDLRLLEQQIDELFRGATPWSSGIRSLPSGSFPAVNVGSTDEAVTVYLFAPGIDPKSLDISLQQNILAIGGTRNAAAVEGATYYRQERPSGQFRRVINLPDDIDPERVEATYRDGVLQIVVKRRESARPRQIKVS